MVQTDEERKAKQRVRSKAYYSRPEIKSKAKKDRDTSEAKEKKKLRDQTPEYKAKKKEYYSKSEVKERKLKRSQRPESKSYQKEYYSRPETKAKLKVYRNSPKIKAKEKEKRDRPEVKEKLKNERIDTRLKVLQYYSKHLSNSDIPCCKCCKELIIDFLAIDHIAGRTQMDSEPKLVKLGYSSKLEGSSLQKWIIKNNFPEGFQILCQNCNFSKGKKKNNNKCAHEMK